jgi:hypothetical protein
MMQLTLGFSIIYALIVMPALLATIGPNGYFGDLWRPLKKLYRLIKTKVSKKENHKDEVANKDEDQFEDLAK